MTRIFILLLFIFSPVYAQDIPLSDYEKKTGVSGSLTSVGSDTLAGIMTLWVEAFKRFYVMLYTASYLCMRTSYCILHCATPYDIGYTTL